MAAFWNIGFTHDRRRLLTGGISENLDDMSSPFDGGTPTEIDDNPLSPTSEDYDDLDFTDRTAAHPSMPLAVAAASMKTHMSSYASNHAASKALSSLGSLATTVNRQSTTVLLQQKQIGELLAENARLREASVSAKTEAETLRLTLDRKAHESETLRMDIDRRNQWIESLLTQINELQTPDGTMEGTDVSPNTLVSGSAPPHSGVREFNAAHASLRNIAAQLSSCSRVTQEPVAKPTFAAPP
ncbi:hypothetical protein HDU93_002565 [Gonapodya sp. JEL0774]|nr:hypothetical protein HDU93_002565 [Gonapodya sp. JEL0774]